MQAFKAANPRCGLEDFIRWHSPRDWVEDIIPSIDGTTFTSKFQLSSRMRDPSNIWQQTWKEVQPLPVSKQKPLFNHITEGEKALHFLETISPSDLIEMMTQTASNIYYNKLTRLPCINFETVNSALSQLPELIISACGTHLKLEEGEGLCLAIAEAEMLFSRATSLMEKFDDNEIVDSLIRTSQMILSGEKKKKRNL